MRRVGAAGYSNDLRERIVDALKQGASTKEAAQRFQVGLDTVRRFHKKDQEGTLDQRVKPPGRQRTVQAVHEQQLLAQLDDHPDASLQEHADMLLTATGLRISYRTVDRVYRRHGITHKKNAGRQRTERGTAFAVPE